MNNYRIFVEKKDGFQTDVKALAEDFKINLNLKIRNLRLINIYDVFNISEELMKKSLTSVFSEIVTEDVYFSINLEGKTYFAVEYLPGQFDQRADSARQLISLIDPSSNVVVKSGKLLLFEGVVDLDRIKKYLINPVESREKDLSALEYSDDAKPEELKVLENFNSMNALDIKEFLDLSLPLADIELVINYFMSEKRIPTETEFKVLDTYWSDHCRHTTFATNLNVTILDEKVYKAYDEYLNLRKELNHTKPITLMDMATINMRYEKANNNLQDLEVSSENNACSIYIDVEGQDEQYLLMFKNETHNHPTEIEPFGGASTCLGGAIRDPLSGRSYVYQAMRITGSGDIRANINDALPGKLPQRVISKKAAEGYSSYGNQIGLSTGHVREIYHEGYVAKRMELGAVIAAAPVSNVVRIEPLPGDVVVLLGGRTGRDGIGGATGSSKSHTNKSLIHSAAEVQKGNAPEERKMQRLFRNPEATKLIKKANDFGAGGVSVAIGELCDGLEINLNAVPTKYSGLNATEIAISESQERMAVIVEKANVEKFIKLANEENLEATIVAKVTDTNHLVMKYNDRTVVNIDRDFINTNGAKQYADAVVEKIDYTKYPKRNYNKNKKANILEHLSDLNICSQKGLTEMFDATIGASTVLMPYGGIYQDTPTQGAVCKIPVLGKETKTCSIMTYGFDPSISSFSPYHGSKQAIIEAIAKTVAIGGDYEKIRFTFQEYFERLSKDPKKWGKPVSSLLGTIETLHDFSLASVGGKDSMSGSFENINVPPTLVAFAVSTQDSDNVITPELKKPGNLLYLAKANYNDEHLVDINALKDVFNNVSKLIKNKKIVSAFSLETGGVSEAIVKMAIGNRLGCKINLDKNQDLYNSEYGSILVEATEKINHENFIYLGEVTNGNIQIDDITLTHEEVLKSLGELNDIYPVLGKKVESNLNLNIINDEVFKGKHKKEVKVLIPVFPGTNCDYDTARAFELAGGKTNITVFKNRTEADINESIDNLANTINRSDIFVICGGFSAGDEPNGSGKFIANILKNHKIKSALNSLIARKGLILGICNGFQALVKAGLLPTGDFIVNEDNPTLVRNEINRHVSKIVRTRVSSRKSPWLNSFKLGEVHNIPISHGEGKFVINERLAEDLFANGQVAFQYCDEFGNPSNNPEDNPNGSLYAIEGITSKDGLILGKMGHSERFGENVFKNIYGNKVQNIFENAVNYFKEVK